MPESSIQKTLLRNGRGPRAVDAGNGHDKTKHGGRRHKDNDDREKHRPRKVDNHHHQTNKGPSPQGISAPGTIHVSNRRPHLELDVIKQPANGISLGMPVETSTILSLNIASAEDSSSASGVDLSRLFAVTSLVTNTRDGDRVPLEAGSLAGQKMFDSVQPIPQEYAESLVQSQPSRLPLGYFSFPGLLVRQAGNFRLRTTLVQMGQSGDAGATALTAVDSEPITVERRSGTAGAQGRQRGGRG